MSELRIGLDVGTTALKAAAYRADGTCVARAERTNRVLRTGPGHAEQDMEQVWKDALACLADVVRGCGNAVIQSIGICGQGDGLWAMDADGRPVGNAMLWNDTRGATDLKALFEAGRTDPIGRGSGTSLWPGTSGILWRWLEQQGGGATAEIATVFTCADWIGYRLTGVVATDMANGSIPFIDLEAQSYSDAQFASIGCEGLKPRLAPLRRASERLGGLTSEAARATGLTEGLPVSVGTLDLAAMILGMGLDQPGQTMLIMGTTAVVNILTDIADRVPSPVGASALHATSDAIIRIMAPSTGAAAFDWFAQLHPQSLGGETPAEVAGKLNALVVKVPVGANGVTFIPYLNGERAPFVAADITAGFHGMRSDTTKADLGRAVMEGTAMSLRHCFESHTGLPSEPVQLTGGGSRNAVWCQIIADIIGQDVVVSEQSDQGLWGAACLGATAAGAGNAMDLVRRTEETTIYTADPERHAAYCAVYQRYSTISTAMRRLQKDLNSLKDAMP
ncbi:FGGY-family carbohydrate kinase [Sulfitobacter sp. 1A13191]|uniref:FGGY-family carbohydrate kinase n=1 Tax=Sulfitobacter sp. 1A13191 TaxID=3368589 RepID=UPI003746334F